MLSQNWTEWIIQIGLIVSMVPSQEETGLVLTTVMLKEAKLCLTLLFTH